ncbi:unnamed protein product, partial [Polarella glacialis]
ASAPEPAADSEQGAGQEAAEEEETKPVPEAKRKARKLSVKTSAASEPASSDATPASSSKARPKAAPKAKEVAAEPKLAAPLSKNLLAVEVEQDVEAATIEHEPEIIRTGEELSAIGEIPTSSIDLFCALMQLPAAKLKAYLRKAWLPLEGTGQRLVVRLVRFLAGWTPTQDDIEAFEAQIGKPARLLVSLKWSPDGYEADPSSAEAVEQLMQEVDGLLQKHRSEISTCLQSWLAGRCVVLEEAPPPLRPCSPSSPSKAQSSLGHCSPSKVADPLHRFRDIGQSPSKALKRLQELEEEGTSRRGSPDVTLQISAQECGHLLLGVSRHPPPSSTALSRLHAPDATEVNVLVEEPKQHNGCDVIPNLNLGLKDFHQCSPYLPGQQDLEELTPGEEQVPGELTPGKDGEELPSWLSLPPSAAAQCLPPPGLERQPLSAGDWRTMCEKDAVLPVPLRSRSQSEVPTSSTKAPKSSTTASSYVGRRACLRKERDSDGEDEDPKTGCLESPKASDHLSAAQASTLDTVNRIIGTSQDPLSQ